MKNYHFIITISKIFLLFVLISLFFTQQINAQADLYSLPAKALVPPGDSLIDRALLISVSPGQTITASPGQTISLIVQYKIWQGSNPYEIDQMFLLYSWSPSWPPPSGYYAEIYNGIPPSYPGTTGTKQISITVPTIPGTYYIWVGWNAHYSVPDAVKGFTKKPSLPAHIKIIVPSSLRVYLDSAMLNGQTLPTSNPELRVSPGSRITGSITFTVENIQPGSWITPVIWVTSWERGSVANGKVRVVAQDIRSTRQFTINIDLNAPSTPGTYYIGVFTAWMYTPDEVASGDHPANYGDGDDVWDMKQSDWEAVISNGQAPEGAVYRAPGRAIRIIVQATYTVSFQVLDDDGKSISGATLVFDGISYSHGGSVSKLAGSYTLSTGAIPSGYRFKQWEASGGVSIASPTSSSTTATISGSGTITMRLQRIAIVTFSASGIGSDTSGTVLVVDGISYTYANLPKTFTWDVGSSHSFAWSDPVSAGLNKRYIWVSTSGLSTAKSGTIVVPAGGGSVTATYKTQYRWIFSQTGIGSDATGTIVTVDGSNYGYSDLPREFWWDSGSSHSYSYKEYVSSSTSGKRYANHSPPSWSGTVSGSESLNPSYHMEYQLSVSISPSGAGSTSPMPGSYWYDSGSAVSVSATPNTGYTFSHWLLDGSNAGSSNPVTVTMNAPHTLTAIFSSKMYTLTVYVYHSGTSSGISGVTVKVDGTSYTTDSSGKVSITVTYGSHTIEIETPYYQSSNTRFLFTQWSDGLTSNPRSISVSSDTTLTAYMKKQYKLTVNVNPSGGGSISANPSSSDWFYDDGTSVILTASASSGYAFDVWSGDASGTSASTSVIINAPKTVIANFFTFTISISPSKGSVTQDGSVIVNVAITYGSGVSSKTVSLSVSGLPSGASAYFNPSSVTINPGSSSATSIMTILTSTSTPAGTYSITITSSGGGLSKTTTYMLTVIQTCTVNLYIYDDSGNAVSGATLSFAGSSYSHGGSVKIASDSYTLSTGAIPSGYRFKQWEASGGVSIASPTSSSTTATISGSGTITMRLQRIAKVTFSVSGMNLNSSCTILVVDSVNYSYSSLPVSFIWDVGSSHSFTWTDYISTGSDRRYAWMSTSGLSTARSGIIVVPSGGGSVTATYTTEYKWMFSVSGLISDAAGTVVTIDGVNYEYSNLPVTLWWKEGTHHSYSYMEFILSSINGKRYACHSPPRSSVIATNPGNVNCSYHVEYLLIIKGIPSEVGLASLSSSSNWYDEGSYVALSVHSPIGFFIQYIFIGWSGDLTSNDSNITIVMNGPKTIIANWRADYTRLYIMGAIFIVLSSLPLLKYIYNRRNRRIRSLIQDIKMVILKRGRISFTELSKECRIGLKDVEKIIRKCHESGEIKGVFTKDGQGYITREKIKEEVMKKIEGEGKDN